MKKLITLLLLAASIGLGAQNAYSYRHENINQTLYNWGFLTYTVNGIWASGLSDILVPGIFEMCEWGDCTLPCNNLVFPDDPSGSKITEDATIDAESIHYWVGNGNNDVRMIVNWCDTAIAFAWGVHFDADSITVQDLLETVSKYDDRFSYSFASTMISDIQFHDDDYQLSLQGNWWMYNVNGNTPMLGFSEQYVHHGDCVKFGDELCADVNMESWQYIWTTPVQAVHLPSDTSAIFDGLAGSENCQAIEYNNPAIIGWASTCTVTRGYQDIAQAQTLASYGSDSDATGPAGNLTTDNVVSLGDGGCAVLTFDQIISNGEGYDFAVFENALNDVFLELAFVEVSSDGVSYYRFPSVSNTQTSTQISNAGSVDASKIHNLAGKYRVGWGTAFDLEELSGYSGLDIDNITHIRVIDVVGSINPLYSTCDKNGHVINDPYPTPFASSGFDLGGVAIMNGWTPNSIESIQTNLQLSVYPNPCRHQFTIDGQVGKTAILYNAFGQELQRMQIREDCSTFNMQHYATGIYFLHIDGQLIKIIKQ